MLQDKHNRYIFPICELIDVFNFVVVDQIPYLLI